MWSIHQSGHFDHWKSIGLVEHSEPGIKRSSTYALVLPTMQTKFF